MTSRDKERYPGDTEEVVRYGGWFDGLVAWPGASGWVFRWESCHVKFVATIIIM
ncbi:hypothetical protein P175DRAFT_0502996 [Aspergillus ochraceoroseus IBT 24754]|uniref:Uncharacterized protein n=1 Tax=Aspergillus ochraceoroseus IBT 24754 TaxID=1392256 RepID=A0A2T5LT43_9EURO|nr:uncharacterized protein P175DRAFT_0502996 [Aspergillus ochraceoroseus IBT 24754]PTU19456.1 hypothetical protein P175DRAFT_0502996 [Aspergillus ochraceoroseus IBT 24754]